MDTKKCSKCGVEKSISEFDKRTYRTTGSGYKSHCRVCVAEWHREWYQKNRERLSEGRKIWYSRNKETRTEQIREYRNTDKGRQVLKKATEKYQAHNPEKESAHQSVLIATRSGKLKKPAKCSQCGKKGRIEGHHPDYNKPLEIVWLCVQCHKKVHIELRKADL